MESYPLWPASWPLRFRKILPCAHRFKRWASAHDWLYEFGGDEFERLMADLEFFELCLEDSDTLRQAVCAFAYFVLVRTFWWAFFKYRDSVGKSPAAR